MIYTSYYAKWNKFSDNYIKIKISRYSPIKDEGLDFSKLFAPSIDLLNKIKEGKITQDEYKMFYISELESKVNPELIKSLFNELVSKYGNLDIVLFCYESPEKPCHRHYLAEWINNNTDLVVSEYKFNK